MKLKTCKCGGQPKVERGPTNPRDLDYMLTIRCQKCGEKVQRMTGGWTEKEETTLNKLAAEWSAKQAHELKPCPFCGGPARMKITPHIPTGTDYTPQCLDPSCCGRITKKWQERETAAYAWNRRADRGNV